MFNNLVKKTIVLILAVAVISAPSMESAAAKSVSAVKRLKELKSAEAATFEHLKKLKAGRDYVADELLVKAKSREEAGRIASAYNASVSSFSKYGFAVLKLKKGGTAASAVQSNFESATQDYVVYPNYRYRISDTVQYVPGDPYFSEQYAHANMNDAMAWDVTRGSADVVVAVIDTGIDTDHPEFTGRISPLSCNMNYNENSQYVQKVGYQYAEDDNGHGTHVAGIIAAAQDNGAGGCGVAPGVTIMAVKANNPVQPEYFDSDDLINGISYAAENGADIINMSLGRSYWDYGYENSPENPEYNAIKAAADKGVLIVCAAGNAGNSHADFPAAYDECVAVSALKADNTFDGSYSNYGPEVDIAAPGTDILSSYPNLPADRPSDPNTWYAFLRGTSMAAPQVSGAVALILSQNPGLNNVGAIKKKLYDYLVDKGITGRDDYYGNGALNTANALYGEQCRRVSFTANGGSSIPSVVSAPNARILAPEQPKKSWYAFAGWFKDAGCTDDWDFGSDTVANDMTLYAKWDFSPSSVKISSFKASSNSYSSVKLSWDAVSGSTGYLVYRAYSGSSTYRKVARITAASFKDTGLTSGTTYKYKVRAYKTVGTATSFSGYSSVISVKPVPAAPAKVKAKKYSSTKIKLTWAKVSGASRYKIYRASSLNGTYAYIGVTTSLKYTSSNLKKAKTYYYKVRAYRKTGGVNGKYSAVVYAKT